MSFFSSLIHNYLFMAAVLGWLIAQVLKVIIDVSITGEINWEGWWAPAVCPAPTPPRSAL